MLDDKTIVLLLKIESNIKKGQYYKLPESESMMVRNAYLSRFDMIFSSDPKLPFCNKAGTLIAEGWNKIVVGDYGAYMEFSPEHMNHAMIKNKWTGKPSRPVKYIWMETKDAEKTKIYFQQGPVLYADYIPGMYYISPMDIYLYGKRLYEPLLDSELL